MGRAEGRTVPTLERVGRTASPPIRRRAAPAGLSLLILVGVLALLLAVPVGLATEVVGPDGRIFASAALRTDASNWGMYMALLDHDGVQLTNQVITPRSAQNLSLIWNFSTGGRIVEEPIVHGKTLYIGSWDGFEYALNATSGLLLWKTFVGKTAGCGLPQPRGPSSTAEFVNGTLYFTGGDSHFYALNAANGSVEWRAFLMNNSPNAGFYGWSSAMIHGGSAYVGLASGCDSPLVPGGVDRIDLTRHSIAAHVNTTAPGTLGAGVWGTPTYDGTTNQVFVSTGNGPANDSYAEAQLALDPKTLAVESGWAIPPRLHVPDGDFGTTPVMVTTRNGTLLDVAGNKDGVLLAFNRSNVSLGPLWATRLATSPVYSSAAFGHGEIFVGSLRTTIGLQRVNGSVQAIGPTTGRLLWEVPTRGKVFGAISYSNGLVAAAGGRDLYLLNATTGATVWSYHANATFQGGMTFAHGMLFVGCGNGQVFAFGIMGPAAGHGSRVLAPGPATWSFGSTTPRFARPVPA